MKQVYDLCNAKIAGSTGALFQRPDRGIMRHATNEDRRGRSSSRIYKTMGVIDIRRSASAFLMSRRIFSKRKACYRRSGNCYESLDFRMKYAFAISYDDLQGTSMTVTYSGLGDTYQQIAVLGMVVIILGRSPLKNPAHPYCFLMIDAASIKPLADLISAS